MVRDNNREPADKTSSSGRADSTDPFIDVRQAAFADKQEQSKQDFERVAYTASAYESVLSLGAKPSGMAALGQRMFELTGGSRPGAHTYNPYRGIPDYRDYRGGQAVYQAPSRVEPPARVTIPDWALAPAWRSRPQDVSRQRPADVPPGPQRPQDVPQPQRPMDAPSGPSAATTRPELLEFRLSRHTDNHGKADAVVYIPAGFDRSKPVNVVVYNHGWNNDAAQCFNTAQLARQMDQAPPNTILIIPEWQKTPDAANGNMGNAAQNGYFRNMFEEIFQRTPALSGLHVDDVAGISIYSHSAGYNPTIKQLYNNGLEDKIKSITMLDSLYDGTAFDPWIQRNIYDLAAGRKHFENFYSGTADQSLAQARRIDQMLQRAGLPRDAMIVDDRSGQAVMDSSTIAARGIVFKRSTKSVGGQGAHSSVASIYVGQTQDARRQAFA